MTNQEIFMWRANLAAQIMQGLLASGHYTSRHGPHVGLEKDTGKAYLCVVRDTSKLVQMLLNSQHDDARRFKAHIPNCLFYDSPCKPT